MNKTVKTILVTVGTVFVLGLGGCFASLALIGGVTNEVVESVDSSITEMEVQAQEEQAILDEIFANAQEPVIERDEYSYNVTYTFTNHSDKDFDYIELGLNVYDKDGAKIDTNWTNITDIKSGQTFKMTADLYQSEAETFEFSYFKPTSW